MRSRHILLRKLKLSSYSSTSCGCTSRTSRSYSSTPSASMASNTCTVCPLRRSIDATCSVASGGYGLARSSCLRSNRRKYECATSMESIIFLLRSRFGRRLGSRLLQKKVQFDESESLVLLIVLWNALIATKPGSRLHERYRCQLVHRAPARLRVVGDAALRI